MRWPLLLLACLCAAQAQPAAPEVFPGYPEGAWQTPWGLRGYPSSQGNRPQVAVEGAPEAAGSGEALRITSSQNEGSNGLCIHRTFTPPGERYVVSFRLRVENLAAFMDEGENRLFIGESRSNSANTTQGTSWALTAAPRIVSGEGRRAPSPGQWSLLDGQKGAGSWVATGVSLEEGVTYEFEITTDRAARRYTVKLRANGQTYESGALGFYRETPEPPILNFAQQYTPGTAATLLLGDVAISTP